MEIATPSRRRIPAPAGAVSPAKLAHLVLATRDLARMRDWYLTVLEAKVVYEDPILCFLTYDDEHHRIAIGALPGVAEREPGVRVGLHHTAFTYRDLGELLYTYRRLKGLGIEPYWCVNHGPTTSMYYRDPDGNRVELQIDNFATAEEATEFMRQNFAENPIGILFEPEELVARYERGEPAESLRRRPKLPPGKTPLDMMRD
ncbi:MAG TPA: VOC family protein [Burkholderiales bacterium]|nr:VOC family protein [Burkholderiales bacterium]